MAERCAVEVSGLGFVVTYDGCPMPRMLPGRLIVFASRTHARALAKAIDADDMAECHRLIAAHGRVFTFPEAVARG